MNNSAMHESAVQLLQRLYGYDSFRGQQEEIINTVVDGNDALVLMPTGGGKSLCYQLPSLIRDGIGVVISPLIALMQDQVNAMQQLGIEAVFLNSSQSRDRQQEIERNLRAGEVQLLYLAPERLLQPRTLELLGQLPLALFAIDEAHCVSQWGHDFRQDYLGLSLLHEQFPEVPRIALTATADQRTREEIVARLQLEQADVFISGFDRPNIRYAIAAKGNARQQLLAFLQNRETEAGIIYCLSRKKVEDTAAWLSERGYTALPYHAGLSPKLRETHQNRFLREDAVIIVATIAFGMGIDKPDVRFVAHLDLPKSIEAYYQETGRAGRDGKPSEAWMIYGLQDVVRLQQMQSGSEASEQFKRAERYKLDAMLGLCEVTSCRRQSLLKYFNDESPDHCGNCDNCQIPPQTWDATEAAQKLLSCVYRTGQRFGVAHIVDVLLGKETDKVQQFEHHQLSTFGIGKDLSQQQWRSAARQLVVRGLLQVDVEGFGAIGLTEQSRPVLRGEQPLQLRKDELKKDSKKSRRSKVAIAPEQEVLWEALRACRTRLAQENNVPPYLIFSDASLQAMLEHRPMSRMEMLAIHGVGEKKLDNFGNEFIEVVCQHSEAVAG